MQRRFGRAQRRREPRRLPAEASPLPSPPLSLGGFPLAPRFSWSVSLFSSVALLFLFPWPQSFLSFFLDFPFSRGLLLCLFAQFGPGIHQKTSKANSHYAVLLRYAEKTHTLTLQSLNPPSRHPPIHPICGHTLSQVTTRNLRCQAPPVSPGRVLPTQPRLSLHSWTNPSAHFSWNVPECQRAVTVQPLNAKPGRELSVESNYPGGPPSLAVGGPPGAEPMVVAFEGWLGL